MNIRVPTALQNIIFDVDGTLIDSQEAILAGLQYCLKVNGIEPKLPLSRDIVGPPLFDILKILSGSSDAVTIKSLTRDFVEYYDSVACLKSPVYDGIDNLLKCLKDRGFDLFIVSNKRSVSVDNIVKHFGWNEYFSAVYGIDSSPLGNFPNKEAAILFLINSFKLDPEKSIYIGDRSEDFLAASANGLKTVLVNWGYGNEFDLKMCSTQTVSTASELERLLFKMML